MGRDRLCPLPNDHAPPPMVRERFTSLKIRSLTAWRFPGHQKENTRGKSSSFGMLQAQRILGGKFFPPPPTRQMQSYSPSLWTVRNPFRVSVTDLQLAPGERFWRKILRKVVSRQLGSW